MKMKKRYDISLDPMIKEMSVKASKKIGRSFSSIVEELLRKWLKKGEK